MQQKKAFYYLDNAATSFPKPEAVYRAIDRTLREAGANPGRGSHRMALESARIVYETRERVAEFFGIDDAARIAFTSNATEAINLGLSGILKAGDCVVTTTMEHNAVVRPLKALSDRGVEVLKVSADREGFVHPRDIRDACRSGATMVIISHCSNVTGTLQPIEEIGSWCRKEGILFFVDAAQSAGLFPIDVESMGIDLLAAPGHKGLMGPPGTGFLYVRPGLNLSPLIFGGTGNLSHSESQPQEMPESLESGTQNTPALAGLKAGIDFLIQEGLNAVRNRESILIRELIEGLKGIPRIIVYGPHELSSRGGVVSFNIEGLDPSEVAFCLDRDFAVFCRAGIHCAPDAHRTIGTFPAGTVRVSVGYFNTAEDIDYLLFAISKIAVRG